MFIVRVSPYELFTYVLYQTSPDSNMQHITRNRKPGNTSLTHTSHGIKRRPETPTPLKTHQTMQCNARRTGVDIIRDVLLLRTYCTN